MKYIIGGVVLVIAVVAIIAIIISLVTQGPGVDTPQPPDTVEEFVDQDSQVSYTVYGSIVAQEEFRAIRMTVNEQQRTLDILEGYELSIQERITFDNTPEAYEAFLQALDTANFTGVQDSDFEDEEGLCPLGRRRAYVLSSGGLEVYRTWSTSCNATPGTYDGNISLTETLFRRQMPEFNQLIQGTRL